MLVFALDRDWTVDVNPHPGRQAVPLEWVRELAHGTRHAVYAIGNQDLAEEAAVPGVVDIVGMHPDDWNRWLGGKRPDGRYERFPTRRERLALIADLHPNADGYVAVDDIDLSDVEGWDHYHAWEFVPAVKRGDVHPDLPFVDETTTTDGDPMPDGGSPAAAGTVPVDADHLGSWLDDQRDAPGFGIEHTVDGTNRTGLRRDVSATRRTLSRAVDPTFRCLPSAPGADPFDVEIAAIEMVHVADPPMAAYLPATDGPAERAAALADLAADSPFAVDVSRVLAPLERDSDTARAAALGALRRVATTRPAACTPALPTIGSLLEEDRVAPAPAPSVVRSVGGVAPADIAPLAEVVTTYLSVADPRTRRQAAGCITELTEADTVDTVPGLTALLDDRAAAHHAAHDLALIAEADPEAAKVATPVLADTLADEALNDGTRLNATVAFGRVATQYPTVATGLVDEVATLLETGHPELRSSATGLLCEIARLHADRVTAHVGTIAELLSADDDLTRENASTVLARIAKDRPDAVTEYVEQVRPLLADEQCQARANVCKALGHPGDAASLSALRAASTEDDHETVRKRARWAVSQIEGPPA